MADPFPEGAERYARFRDWVGKVVEAALRGLEATGVSRVGEPGRRDGESESELEIQARWFGGEFGREFTGEDGERIEIVQFGHWNRGAGPDFTEAAIRVDDRLLAGAIELDLDARDWEGHGHGENPGFESVVLHVYTDGPSLKRFYTRTLSHRRVVQLQLPQYAWSQGPPDFLPENLPEAFPGRCVAPLATMTDTEVDSLLRSAAQYRLRGKAARFEVMRSAVSPDQALFQAVAEALGFRANQTAMAVLAQRCPIRLLRDLDSIEREAILFGTAGFLTADRFDRDASSEARPYLRALWDCWWKLRDRFEPGPHRGIPWRGSGQRPLNHPQRRIGALSAVIANWDDLGPIWECPGENVKRDVNNFLKNLHHPFWERQYTFHAQPSPKPLRLVGRDRAHDLLGNVVFPGATGQDGRIWSQYASLGAVDSNRDLRRAALRLFGPDRARRKLFTTYYYQQQGLLQIFRDFCLEDVSDCATCPFPEQLQQWRRFTADKAGPTRAPVAPS